MEKIRKTIDVFVAVDGKEFTTEFNCLEHERQLEDLKGLSEQQERNRITSEEWNNRVIVQRMRQVIHPEEHAEFMSQLKASNILALQEGVKYGWWPSADDHKPAPWPLRVKISELEPNETTMAHIFAKLQIFESIGDARKNGWNKPATPGEHWFRKKTVHVIIEV